MGLGVQLGKKLASPFVLYSILIMLGIVVGLSSNAFLVSLGQVISDVFIRIFRCISTPIIGLSIMVTLATYGAETTMNHVWRKTIFYTITTTLVAAAVSCLLYLIIQPTNVHDVATQANSALSGKAGYLEYLVQLIPASIFAPFLEHQVMGVLLIGIVVGLAIRHIPDKKAREAVTSVLVGAQGLFFVITKWIVAVLPIGLFGFVSVTAHQFNQGTRLSGIGMYLAVIVLANLVQGLIVLPMWLTYHGIRPLHALKQMLPALSVAFFSKSSSGSLPVTMATIESNLKVEPSISRFVLPLCTSLNMNGCAAFIFTTVIYLMQNQGIDISLGTMVLWVFISTVAAIGNAGVPMGCFFLSASLLSSMDVPIVLLGIILPFYNVIDMIETALNVWSDSCVATVVNQEFAIGEAVPINQAA